MSIFEPLRESPGLLVSVRNAAEARAALAGGADVIDVKEPSLGSLGAAKSETISDIVRSVEGQAPVSAAMGELVDLVDSSNAMAPRRLVDGVTLFKIGLAGCAELDDWQVHWRRTATAMSSPSRVNQADAVAVVYADWQDARSPAPLDVLNLAIENRCAALLIDTWAKTGRTLFDYWPTQDLQGFLTKVRAQGIAIVLAGALKGRSIVEAARLAPNLVAVRTAACEAGRESTVSEKKVRELKTMLETTTRDMAVL